MTALNASVRDNPTDHRYEVVLDGQVAGVSHYELDAGRIAFTHTEVGDTYRGHGLGRKLVDGMLADAEEWDLAVVPFCPYVRRIIAEDPSRYLHLRCASSSVWATPARDRRMASPQLAWLTGWPDQATSG